MENIELLKKVRIFYELAEAELKRFAEIAQEKKFIKDTVIIEEGAEGQALFIVKRGTVSVSKIDQEMETELVKLVAGEHFGEMSLLDNAKTSARVKAYNDVECIGIGRDQFLKLLDQEVAIAAKVYKNFALALSDRLRGTSEELVVWKPDVEL